MYRESAHGASPLYHCSGERAAKYPFPEGRPGDHVVEVVNAHVFVFYPDGHEARRGQERVSYRIVSLGLVVAGAVDFEIDHPARHNKIEDVEAADHLPLKIKARRFKTKLKCPL